MQNNSKTTNLMCLIHINYYNRNIILTSSSSALGDLFAFGAEKENNYNICHLYEQNHDQQLNYYKKYITCIVLINGVYKNYTFTHSLYLFTGQVNKDRFWVHNQVVCIYSLRLAPPFRIQPRHAHKRRQFKWKNYNLYSPFILPCLQKFSLHFQTLWARIKNNIAQVRNPIILIYKKITNM